MWLVSQHIWVVFPIQHCKDLNGSDIQLTARFLRSQQMTQFHDLGKLEVNVNKIALK